MTTFKGVLPAAGLGSRLRPFLFSKELLPIAFVREAGSQRARPILAAEYSVQAMRAASIERCLIVIADWKTEIMRYFGDGSDYGMYIAYLHRREPKGLADAIDAAYQWWDGSHACLCLPDTIFHPKNALALLTSQIHESRSDVLLGVFPTNDPRNLAPVVTDPEGRVVRVLDKPSDETVKNTWGLAVWSPRFTEFLHSWLHATSERSDTALSSAFEAAAHAGLDVRARNFPGGSFVDIGRVESLGSLILSDMPD